MTTLIIGYGNPLREDDGLGWQIAARLTNSPLAADLEVIQAYQLYPEMSDPISQADRVIFVDAAVGDTPGVVHVESVEPASQVTGTSPFTHDLTPAVLLAAAKMLFDTAPPAWVITVTGARFGFGEALSPQIHAAIPKVIAHIERIVDQDPSTNETGTL